ncbi:MAG: hypothetical protein K2F90_03385 [Clostridiales bacterium]|nr:hypothetical protein [Clostridiales bacterium]
MKKILTLTVTALITASALCGCGKSAAAGATVRLPEQRDTQQSQVQRENRSTERNAADNDKIEITLDGNKIDGFVGQIRTKTPISGVKRHFIPDRSGTYTVEYIHTPYGIDKDETLDYKLTLNDDNTFTLTVVSDGVTAEHSGRWYERRKEIMMFYDEEIEQPPHNVYVSDSMFGDLLPKGKIMIYDNCYTIVLSQSMDEAENK